MRKRPGMIAAAGLTHVKTHRRRGCRQHRLTAAPDIGCRYHQRFRSVGIIRGWGVSLPSVRTTPEGKDTEPAENLGLADRSLRPGVASRGARRGRDTGARAWNHSIGHGGLQAIELLSSTNRSPLP